MGYCSQSIENFDSMNLVSRMKNDVDFSWINAISSFAVIKFSWYWSIRDIESENQNIIYLFNVTICRVGFRVSYERGVNINYSTCRFHFQTIPEFWLVKQSEVQISKCKNIRYPITKSHLFNVEWPPSLLDLGVEVILLSPNLGLNLPSVTIISAFKRATC